jgi:predicted signal transduction protein with EAL and GGDEF domain
VERRYRIRSGRVAVGCSAGWIQAPHDAHPDELLIEADRRMYRDKDRRTAGTR